MRRPAPRRLLVVLLAALVCFACETSVAPDLGIRSLEITPRADTLQVGESLQLSAAILMNNGRSAPTPTWSTSNSSALTVSTTGVVTAVAIGTAVVRASVANYEDSSTFVVQAITTPPPPPGVIIGSVTVAPSAPTLVAGATVQLTATVRDANGQALSGITLSWTSGNRATATVSATGLVTGVAAGSAAMTAAVGDKSGTALVTVTAPAPPLCSPTGSGVCRYVDGNAGNDGNAGTSSQPYRTLAKAAGVVNPGDVVIVRDGIYTGSSSAVFSIPRGGTGTNLVVFKAEHQWGAIIDGQSNYSATGIEVRASYVRVEGFDVRNTNHYGVDMGSGQYGVQIARNNVHDIGHQCSGTTSGFSGFDVLTNDGIIEQNVIHDIGRYGPGEHGCSPPNAYYQNHDHGMYLSDGSNIIIRNNVFYNITHGWAIHRYNVDGKAVDRVYIVNNTFVFPNPYRVGQIIINCPMSNSLIANNIFYQPTEAGILLDSEGGSVSSLTVRNNITYGGVAWSGSTSGATLSNNLNNTDPRLVNASGLNFHLQSDSPAIGFGMALSYVTGDFDGLIFPAQWDPKLGIHVT